MKALYPLELVQEQIQLLKKKLKTTGNIQEKNVLFKRLVNLLGVMEFLLTINKH
jgi:hypothetical protein